MSITIGLWIIPAFLSLLVIMWVNRQDYSGDYNFSAVVFVPIGAFLICFVWMVYFAAGWLLS